jgi:choline dehydrogenase-like flavoprotein
MRQRNDLGTVRMVQTFDVLIVGGGSAGCVLAGRLSEDPALSVALVESGGRGDSALINTPAAVIAMLPTRLNNWAFETVAQPGLNGRRGYQPRGRALGGTSAINAMVYIRGHPSDYDHWASLGNTGWSYAEVLPYFKRAECNTRGADDYHGDAGPLGVADLRTDNPFHDRYRSAAEEAGFALNPDFNGADQEGLGVYQVTQVNGERCSAARAYLQPWVGARSNLHVLTRTHAQRILLEGQRAVGVEVLRGGRRETLHARREVVLAAGAFHSPQLLMLSGIGDGEALQRMGIEVRQHLPGVGGNLQDHIDFIFGHEIDSLDLFGFSPRGLLRAVRESGRYWRTRRGMLTSNYAECGGFLKLTPESPVPDVQLHFVLGIVDDHARKLHLAHGISCHVCLLHPKSRGRVTLASPDAGDAPLIDPAFYAEPDDLERMVAGFKLTRRLLEAPSLARLYKRDLFTADVHGDEQIREVLRARSDTVYHPVGTCKMGNGNDPLAVVDRELRVHGLQSLRVVDASIMPTIVGGNTNAPTIMIGEKAADLIRAT